MTKKNQTYYCHSCDCELSDENCRNTLNSVSGYSHLCISCENDLFNRLAQTEGKHIALFHTCACLNVPCKPIALEDCQDEFADSGEAWILYVNKLSEKKQDTKRGRVLGFADGLTSLAECFGGKLDHKDFAEYIVRERAKTAKLEGSSEQREKWGTEPLYSNGKSSIRMTQEVYDELDRQYSNRAESYKGQTLTPQMEDILVKVAKSNVIYDYLMRTGVVKLALDVQKSIDLMLASENMRKKDEKPTEQFRMDALVVALEKFGCMENGDFLSYDELVEVLKDKFVKSKKYDYSLDVADQVILDVLNAGRKNADLMPFSELPDGIGVVDEYGECEPKETEEEKKRKEFAGLTKVQFENKNNEDKEEKL